MYTIPSNRHEAEQEMTDVVFEDATTDAIVDSYVKSPIEDTECLAYWSRKEVEAAGSPAKEALVSRQEVPDPAGHLRRCGAPVQ